MSMKAKTAKLLEDRRVLERIIFPAYACDPAIRTVLFVGCEFYTEHYARDYFANHNYWTLEPDPTRKHFGAPLHVTARLEQLGQHFPAGFFDLIVCNGVYGWGLNRAEDCEQALAQCHACLCVGGHLLFGWNDLPRWDPVPLRKVRSFALFSRYEFPPLHTAQYLTSTSYRHTYWFFRK
jgi:hypothetical protein